MREIRLLFWRRRSVAAIVAVALAAGTVAPAIAIAEPGGWGPSESSSVSSPSDAADAAGPSSDSGSSIGSSSPSSQESSISSPSDAADAVGGSDVAAAADSAADTASDAPATTVGGNDASVTEMRSHMRAPSPFVHQPGALHHAFADNVWLIPQLGMDPVEGDVGTIDAATAITQQNAVLRRFFDRYISG